MDLDLDPGSALEKNRSMDPSNFFKIAEFLKFLYYFCSLFFCQNLMNHSEIRKSLLNLDIFADLDPRTQNLADPRDPDPKHFYLGKVK